MYSGHNGDPKGLHHQYAVAQGLIVMNNIETAVTKQLAYFLIGPEAE
jgi:hypothetical protein